MLSAIWSNCFGVRIRMRAREARSVKADILADEFRGFQLGLFKLADPRASQCFCRQQPSQTTRWMLA